MDFSTEDEPCGHPPGSCFCNKVIKLDGNTIRSEPIDMTNYTYDEDPKKHKLAQQDAKDRKIAYLEELVRTGIEQQKKWQQKYFKLKEEQDKVLETTLKNMRERRNQNVEDNNGTKGNSREDLQ